MRPDIVVDIGNTFIKWGRCSPDDSSLLATASLTSEAAQWNNQLDEWSLKGRLTWAVASVQPHRCEQMCFWLERRGDPFVLLNKAGQLPLKVALEHPDRAGIDRLLNAVAARSVLPAGRPAVLIDAGSAVTCDWLDEEHTFRGGAIYPGIDLMAQALNHYTALLPRVSLTLPIPSLPGKATVEAMQIGIFLAVAGGIQEAVRRYAEQARTPPRIFFTGGQARLLSQAMGLANADLPRPAGWTDFLLWPEQTLVGILRSVEALP